MPTGYTAGVQDGKITEFREFALQCARNFGALIMLRDESIDTPIPQEFEPSTYYSERLKELRSELLMLESLTPEQSNSAASKEFDKNLASFEQRKRDRETKKARYEAMLDKARSWKSPSPDHDGLKDFMCQQLEESIRFDCDGSYDKIEKPMIGDEWRIAKIKECRKSIDYHEAEDRKERERTDGRNKWIKQLREAL